MTATASDYAWFEDDSGLAESYCVTLARGLTPSGFLLRIGAQAAPSLTGLDLLCERSMDLWRAYEGERLLIGVATAQGDGGGWALAFEFNGYLGVTEELIVPLSAGTRVVSHYSSVAGPDQFYWIEDRDIRLHFDPVEPAYRDGSTPDAVADVMREVGFDLREDGDNTEHCTAAALALAEHLTGVRLTPELLEASTYTCGIVPAPPL